MLTGQVSSRSSTDSMPPRSRNDDSDLALPASTGRQNADGRQQGRLAGDGGGEEKAWLRRPLRAAVANLLRLPGMLPTEDGVPDDADQADGQGRHLLVLPAPTAGPRRAHAPPPQRGHRLLAYWVPMRLLQRLRGRAGRTRHQLRKQLLPCVACRFSSHVRACGCRR